LPQAHDGRQEALVLVHEGAVIDPRPGAAAPPPCTADCYLVLRLWPSDVKLRAPEQSLWVGNITSVRMKHPLPLFTVPLGDNVFNDPQHDFQPFLKGLTWRTVRRPEVMPTDRWDGSAMLITAPLPAMQGGTLPEVEPHRQGVP